jgi:hypothetical protein
MCEDGIEIDSVTFVCALFRLGEWRPWCVWFHEGSLQDPCNSQSLCLQGWPSWLCMLAIWTGQRRWWRQCPVNQMQLFRWPCLVLAESMVKWNWESGLENNFLNWTLLWQWAILHIYAAASRWDLSENIQKQRKERCFRK